MVEKKPESKGKMQEKEVALLTIVTSASKLAKGEYQVKVHDKFVNKMNDRNIKRYVAKAVGYLFNNAVLNGIITKNKPGAKK